MKNRLMNFMRNNKGSGLLMVMIGITFIAILGTTIMAVTYTNLKLKTLDHQAKETYFSAETLMEEIKAGVEEKALHAIELAHEDELKNFIGTSSEDRLEQLKNNFFLMVRNSVAEGGNVSSITDGECGTYDLALLESFTSARNQSGDIEVTIKSSDESKIMYYKDKSKLVLKGIYVELKKDNMKSTVLSDIVVGMPAEKKDDASYIEYSLISDTLVEIDGTTEVGGSVYGGSHPKEGVNNGVIVGDTGNLTMSGSGSRLISGKDVEVMGMGQLNVANSEVWTNNFRLGSTKSYHVDRTVGPLANVNGKMYVGGDLYLDEYYSKAVLSGSYYGYSSNWQELVSAGGIDARNAASSSAIVINGRNSSLDMRNVNELVIAGHSYIATSSKSSDAANSDRDVLEGESIASKKNETIYLLDKNFLYQEARKDGPAAGMIAATNPSSALDVATITAGTTRGSAAYADLLIDPDAQVNGKKFAEIKNTYLDPSQPLRCVTTQGGDTSVVYFYYNFKSKEASEAFFNDIYHADPTKFKENYDMFVGSDGIKINTTGARYDVLGWVIYSDNNGALKEKAPSNGTNIITSIEEEGKRNSEIFLSLQTYLKKYEGVNPARLAKGYVASVMDFDRISADATNLNISVGGQKFYEGKGILIPNTTDDILTKPHIYLIDNKDSGAECVVQNGMSGIIVASGKVKFATNNINFTGLVMSKEEIIGEGTNRVTYDTDMLRELFASIDSSILDKYFLEYPNKSSSSKYESNFIGYQNYVKDEELD